MLNTRGKQMQKHRVEHTLLADYKNRWRPLARGERTQGTINIDFAVLVFNDCQPVFIAELREKFIEKGRLAGAQETSE